MRPMLERYKRTFFVTQAVIAAVTVAVFFQAHHRWLPAAAFFAAMQVGALTGALWAARLKRKIERTQGLLASR
jgi:uncharacterized membrane protein YfcA